MTWAQNDQVLLQQQVAVKLHPDLQFMPIPVASGDKILVSTVG